MDMLKWALYFFALIMFTAISTSERRPYLKSMRALATPFALSSAMNLLFAQPTAAVVPPINVQNSLQTIQSKYGYAQSKGWEFARQKRTAAVKEMQAKGILKVDTDDSGNQFLSLPWIPDRKLPYKSLSVQTRLTNEVCAGAFGEIAKDTLLYSVDTMKTRRQASGALQPKNAVQVTNETIAQLIESNNLSMDGNIQQGLGALAVLQQQQTTVQLVFLDIIEAVQTFPTLYAGFPIVALASIPQGGVFFLVKKGLVELFAQKSSSAPTVVADIVPIILGVMVYWLFRTPAEVIKTQVQTGQVASVSSALREVFTPNAPASESSTVSGTGTGFLTLYQRYPVMLSLDIPFQLINFVLYGWLSDLLYTAPGGLHWQQTFGTRLLSGITCGMVAAALTCPLDVCKTRMIARQKEACSLSIQAVASVKTASDNTLSTEQHGDVTHDNNAVITADVHAPLRENRNNVLQEMITIYTKEGAGALFLGFGQRLLYTGLANGIRLSAYGTSRMDLMMRSLERL